MTPGVYPIAETFTSIQGEGVFSGVQMHFIRIAGCSVGRPIKSSDPMWSNVLPVYTEKCTLYDGREFYCDTDFRARGSQSVSELLQGIPKGIRHICITGGEPMNYDLTPLIGAVKSNGIKVHIETSGTVPIAKGVPRDEEYLTSSQKINHVWITVSPKFKALPEVMRRADEIKLLVDEKFDINKLPLQVTEHPVVWIQPVNFENGINSENVKRCLEILKQRPSWRLSVQLHKIVNVR